MANHSSILVWKNPRDREVWWAIDSMGLQRVRHNLATEKQQFICRYIFFTSICNRRESHQMFSDFHSEVKNLPLCVTLQYFLYITKDYFNSFR